MTLAPAEGWWFFEAEHHSSKYLKSAESLLRVITAAIVRVPIVSVTEVDRTGRGDALADIPGTQLVRGPDGARGETAILVDTAHVEVLKTARTMLIDDLDGMRGGQVAVAILGRDRETGCTVLYSATHTASGVESGSKSRLWRAGVRAVQYQQAARAWRRWLKELKREWRPDAAVAVADMNLNLLFAATRAYVRTVWRKARLPHYPGRGTHGRRLIDWFLSWRLRKPALTVLKKSPASDHCPIGITGTIRPRKRKEK